VLFLFLLFNGTSCKELQKKITPSGINVMIHDMACSEVKGQLIKNCKLQHCPFEWGDNNQDNLWIGPLITYPLLGDSFAKMEEKYKMEIKCIDPISTRISVQIQLKGLTADNQWLEIKDPGKLNAYGQRLLDQLIKP
jgi:hypothetical protein